MSNQIIKKVIKIFLFSFLLYSPFCFAAQEDPYNDDILKHFFSEPFESHGNEEGCEIRCRMLSDEDKYKVSKKYYTKIVDFDATTGVTTCDVIPKNSSDSYTSRLSVMANFKDIDCLKEYEAFKPNYNDPELASNKYKANTNNITKVTIDDETNPETKYDRSRITLSKLLGGVTTLNMDMVDLKATVETGIFTRTNEADQDTYLMNSSKAEDVSKADNTTETSNEQSGDQEVSTSNSNRLYDVSDKLSKENLGYFVNLLYETYKVQAYALVMLLVAVALYFMGAYFTDIFMKKLAKKPTTYDKPWQGKLLAIVIVFTFFYMGIKVDNNYSATPFQNTFKYVVDEGISIADKANMTAMKVLMQNSFNKVGATGVETEANLKVLLDKQIYLVDKYNDLLYQCRAKYPYRDTFQETNIGTIIAIEEFAEREGTETDLVYRGCRSIEKRHKIAITSQEQLEYMLSRVETAYTNNIIAQKLQETNNFIASTVTKLGFFSVVLAPTLDNIVTNSYMQSNSSTPPPVNIAEGGTPESGTYEARVNEASETKIAIHENDKEGGSILANILTSNPKEQKEAGAIFGTLAQSLNPWFNSVYRFVATLGANDLQQILKLIPADKYSLQMIEKTDNKIAKLNISILVSKKIAELVPSMVGFLGASIQIVYFFFSLIVFVLFSPFVILFAFTRGDAQKITEFLIKGIRLFLLPVAIVFSVYLAIFLFHLYHDIFMTMVDEQIYLVSLSSDNLWSAFTLSAIRGLLIVVDVGGSCFILWKTIMNLPNYAFKTIGLNEDGGAGFTQSMQGMMSKFGMK